MDFEHLDTFILFFSNRTQTPVTAIYNIYLSSFEICELLKTYWCLQPHFKPLVVPVRLPQGKETVV